MLHLEGDKEFAQPREAVWAKLTDLTFLVQCIPDVTEVKEVTADTATVVQQVGFAFVRGSIELTIAKVEATPPAAARFRFTGKGIGTSSTVETAFRLEAKDGGSALHWSADVVQLGGLLKAVPQGLLHGAAQKIIGDLLKRIEEKLGASTA
jgi:carbon monoxide dehydrogenase subunit G